MRRMSSTCLITDTYPKFKKNIRTLPQYSNNNFLLLEGKPFFISFYQYNHI